MSVAETILVFVGGPLIVIAVLAALTLRPAKGQKRLRYKSGQPWDHAPLWFEPHPETPGIAHGDGHGRQAIAAAPSPVSAGPLGGARGTW